MLILDMVCTVTPIFGYASIETSATVSQAPGCHRANRGCRSHATDPNPDNNSATDVDLPPLFASDVEGGNTQEWSR